jgi:hypothetical protein
MAEERVGSAAADLSDERGQDASRRKRGCNCPLKDEAVAAGRCQRIQFAVGERLGRSAPLW